MLRGHFFLRKPWTVSYIHHSSRHSLNTELPYKFYTLWTFKIRRSDNTRAASPMFKTASGIHCDCRPAKPSNSLVPWWRTCWSSTARRSSVSVWLGTAGWWEQVQTRAVVAVVFWVTLEGKWHCTAARGLGSYLAQSSRPVSLFPATDEQFVLKRIADGAIDIYAMVVVLSRCRDQNPLLSSCLPPPLPTPPLKKRKKRKPCWMWMLTVLSCVQSFPLAESGHRFSSAREDAVWDLVQGGEDQTIKSNLPELSPNAKDRKNKTVYKGEFKEILKVDALKDVWIYLTSTMVVVVGR